MGTIEGVSGNRVVLVGEANPYGADPRYALYCEPSNSAGGRLCNLILQMGRNEYVRTFDRVNLCPQKWSMPVARARAEQLRVVGAPLVLFGSKVCDAFGLAFVPFSTVAIKGEGLPFLRLPHPSGLCRLWGEDGGTIVNFARARALILGLVTGRFAQRDGR